MEIIDIEHHFGTPAMLENCFKVLGITNITQFGFADEKAWEALERLAIDLDDLRIEQLDKAGVTRVHLSLSTPGSEFFEPELGKKIACEANNVVAEAIARHPDRYGAYIALAPDDIEWSLKEIDRCLEMGLWGWSALSNFHGARLDDKKYWPILKKCEELGMPIYLHPMFPANKELHEYGSALSGPSFGFTYDTQYTFLRMICAGVFDEYPNLKVILGHDAEGFAFYKNRINAAYRQGYGQPPKEKGHLEHEPSYYLEKNLYGSTSGNFLPEAMRMTNEILGEGRLMFATDFPYEDFQATVDLVKNDPKLSEHDREAILYKNAKALGLGYSHKK